MLYFQIFVVVHQNGLHLLDAGKKILECIFFLTDSFF